jgi:tripeptidyl-peptidase-1
MLSVSFLVISCVAVFSSARTYTTRIPAGWASEPLEMSPEAMIKVSIALKSKDATLLEKFLLEISTPGSSRFRKYLKQQEITEIVGRSDDEFTRIQSWVESSNGKILNVPPHKDWIEVSLPLKSIETAFNCKLVKFLNTKTGRSKIAALNGYTIPSEFEDLFDLVSGLNTFPGAHWTAIRRGGLSADAPAQITPETIYDVYQTDSSGKPGSKLGSQAVVEFGNAANFNTADLQTFFKDYQSSLQGQTCSVVYGNIFVKKKINFMYFMRYLYKYN